MLRSWVERGVLNDPRARCGDFDEEAPWGEGAESLAAGRFPVGVAAGGAAATLPQLCSRVASLHFLRLRLAEIEREVPARFAQMQRGVGGGGGGDEDKARAWLEGLLDGARQTLASCALKVRRCRLTVSTSVLKAPMVSVLETKI
jgi:hypothetical protein